MPQKGKTPVGLRALTMQQPFAAAMANGVGLFSRRGKPARFHLGRQSEWKGSTQSGEWVAVHCGQNSEHLNNASLMKAVRSYWPACPSDNKLREQQRCILGVVHFVDGNLPAASGAAAADFFLNRYTCTKSVAWRGDKARPCSTPLSYPKGNLQIWQINREGFANGLGAERELLALLDSPSAGGDDGTDDDDCGSGATSCAKASVAQRRVTVKKEKKDPKSRSAVTRTPSDDVRSAKRTKRR